MKIELEELEMRCSPSGIQLTGSIAQQAAQLQQYVQQQVNAIVQPAINQFNATHSQLSAELLVLETRMVIEAIEPAVLGFISNGLGAMGDPNAAIDLASFASSLGQVDAALGVFGH